MVSSLEVIMKKTPSGPMMISTNGNGGAGNREAAEEVVGPITAIWSPGPKYSKSRRKFNCSR
jgi:hypothetical protein